MTKIKEFLRKNGWYMLASFFIPVLIMILVYYSRGIYWNSSTSILSSDSFSQYSNFHLSLKHVFSGKASPFYTFDLGMGLNYYAFMSYYLGGIFTPLICLFDSSNIPNALYILTLIKLGAAGLTFWIYAKNTFKINRLLITGLSTAYCLMSFTVAQSEIVMWLDAMVWLPLVILGINRVIDYKRPRLLFFSYFILFISNYYFGFMIGLFSFMYFLVIYFANFSKNKSTFKPYIITSLLSGIASLVMILPMYLDLKVNGEQLSPITMTKTDATSWWDLIVKNMIGVYDTTQYNSIPFIYIGILPLLFCLFYFISRKFDLKHKLGFGTIAIFIIASFYFTPLDLMWQGFHFPNMFLFRYAFLLSFLVIMLAGYGLEKYEKEDTPIILFIGIVLLIAYTLAYFVHSPETYKYVKVQNFALSIIFLIAYLLIFAIQLLPLPKKLPFKIYSIILLILMCGEAGANSYYMIHALGKEWGFPETEQYNGNRKPIQALVDESNKLNKGIFYRLENLDQISTNDSIAFQYPGLDLFSSVRNRNSSALFNNLGFKADGTALNSRYANNTLLMDSLIGMRYNISLTDINKFGFKQVDKAKNFKLYENKYALPLGVQTTDKILSTKLYPSDNLSSQENLINSLANKKLKYYKLVSPELLSEEGGSINQIDGINISKVKVDPGKVLTLTYSIDVPKGKQAAVSLFPTSNTGTGSACVTSDYNAGHWTEIGLNGQYYNIGYFKKDTTVEFTVHISGVENEFEMITPLVLLTDIPNYKSAMKQLDKQGVDFKVDGRKATATVNMKGDNNTIFTTIPYDKGWNAYVDGKKVEIRPYRNGVVTFKVPKGKHKIELSYFPPGLKLGIVLLIVGLVGFFLYDSKLENRKLKFSKKK